LRVLAIPLAPARFGTIGLVVQWNSHPSIWGPHGRTQEITGELCASTLAVAEKKKRERNTTGPVVYFSCCGSAG